MLTDPRSMCNWVAWPEISLDFNTETELGSRKAKVGRSRFGGLG